MRALAVQELRDNILDQPQPPVDRDLVDRQRAVARGPGPVAGRLHRSARRGRRKQIDPTRPVGLAVAGYPRRRCQPEYGPLDVIGINDYFGWYPGPSGQIADRTLLCRLPRRRARLLPDKALVVTEFGAEANRDGPPEEKGTYPSRRTS